MSVFCNNCGRELPENVINCTYCGTPVNGWPNNNDFNNIPSKSKNKIKPILIIGGVVVLIAVVVVVLVLLLGNEIDGAKACEDYYIVVYEGDADRLENLAPSKVINSFEKKYNVELKDVCEYFEDVSEGKIERIEERWDTKATANFEVIAADDVHEQVLRNAKEEMKEDYNISKSDVDDVKACCVKLIIETEDDDYIVSYMNEYVVQIDGDWYTASGVFLLEEIFSETSYVKNGYYDYEDEFGY